MRRACSVHWRTAEAPVPCCCKAEQVRCSSLGSAGPQEEALRQLCVSFASAAPACVSGRAEVPKRPRGSSRAAIKQRRPTPAGKSWSGGGGDLSAALRSEATESSTPQRGERAARSWRGRLPLRRRPRRRRGGGQRACSRHARQRRCAEHGQGNIGQRRVAALELAEHQSQHGPGALGSVGLRQVCARRELDQRQGAWQWHWGGRRHGREALVELTIQAWQREREH